MKKGRLRKFLRRIGIGFIAFCVLLVLLWVFRFPLFGGLIRNAVTDALHTAGFEASYGELSGTLLGDVTVTDFEIGDSPGLPALTTARVGRVHASYSLIGLLLGEDRWIREVAVENVTGVLDLSAPPPPETEETPPSGPLTIDLIPARVRLSGIDLDVMLDTERFTLKGGRASADAEPGAPLAGSFGADDILLQIGSRQHRAVEPNGRFEFAEGVATVFEVTANERRIEEPLRVDLSRLDQSVIDARLDFPLLGGQFFLDVLANFGGEVPELNGQVRLTRLDPSYVMAFLPDIPASAERVSVDITFGTTDREELSLSDLQAQITLHIEDPVYGEYRLGAVKAGCTLADGVLKAEGEINDPPGSFKFEGDLFGETGAVLGSVDLDGLDVKRLLIQVDERQAAGVVTVSAEIAGTFEQPTFAANATLVSPALGEYGADSIKFVGRGDPDLVTIEQLRVTRGADAISVTGEVRPSAEPISFDVKVHAEVVDVAAYREFVPAEVPADLAGSLVLDVTADGTPEEPGAAVTLVLTGAGAEGFFTEKIELAASAPTAEVVELKSLTVKGRGDLPDVALRDAVIRLTAAGLGVLAPNIAVTREDWKLSSNISARLEPDGEMATEVTIDSLDIAAVTKHFGLDLKASGSLTGTISASGTPEKPRAAIDLTIREPRSELVDLRGFTAQSADLRVRFEDDLLTVETLSIKGQGFELGVDAQVPFSLAAPEAVAAAPISGNVRIITLPLDLAGEIPGIGTIEGMLGATLAISGTAEDPRVSGELGIAVPRIVLTGFEGIPVTDIVVTLKPENLGAKGGRLTIEDLHLEAAGARLDVSGSIAHGDGKIMDPRLDLEITAIDIATIRSALGVDFPLTGHGAFGLHVTPGPVVNLQVDFPELALPNNPDMKLSLGGEWRDGTFTFGESALSNQGRDARITGTVPFDLSLSPLAAGPSPDRKMDVVVTIAGLDLATLPLDSEGIRLAGSVDATAVLSGIVTEPDIDASLILANVRFRSEGVPGVDKLSGTIRFNREGAEIESLAGTLGRGAFSVSGNVAIVDGVPGKADLRIKADNAQLVRSEGMRLRTDLDLTITGSGPGDLTIGGTVTVRSLKVGATGLLAAQDLDAILAGIKASPSLATLPLTTDPMLKDIKLDVTLLIPVETVKVRTNLVKATANGKLLVGGTLAIPRPRGRIYVSKGTVFLIAGQLELEKPIVTFKEGEPLVPYIDGRATARISGVDVYVDINGSASNARILFSSVPALPTPDIVSLILTGVTRANLGSDALSGMASSYLLRQLSSNFSDDDDEGSAVGDILSRIELEFDDSNTNEGGIPGFTATVRILDWLFVRGQQESALDYGFDLIFRLTFP